LNINIKSQELNINNNNQETLSQIQEQEFVDINKNDIINIDDHENIINIDD
ncbi:10095_t:CDS:1, partial [Cetraspora pellucida]